MKQLLPILSLLLSITCFAQSPEFNQSPNSLIYSDATVAQLKFIVDSLNLKFKVCELDKKYGSHFQAVGHCILLDSGDVAGARTDIERNIAFGDFIKKYPGAEVDKDLLVLRYAKSENDAGKEVMSFRSVEINDRYFHQVVVTENLDRHESPLKGAWVYEYNSPKSKYYKNGRIEAFFFPTGFSQVILPTSYARMIQYSDCMVDTAAQVFYEKAEESDYAPDKKEHPELISFMKYVDDVTQKPEWDKKEPKKYLAAMQVWDSLQFFRIDSVRKQDGQFDRMLKKAVDETLAKGGAHDPFEAYVERYYSPATALEMKRNRRVYGSCSQDDSPRLHALEIAKLSAKTAHWEIFLRAHLNIMNDRFDRMTDGSYAWGRRQTYIRELEVLDINVLDLLLGISLRVENVSDGHYYGSIGRLGRALSETSKSDEIEAKMLQMIADPQLDDYNRLLMYYLFLNYNHYQEDKAKQAEAGEKLMAAAKTLPEYLSSKITTD